MSDETQSKSTYFPFAEGLPTRPDVDLLLKTWPHPKIGDRFPYEAIERLFNLSHRDNRFRTITNSWRHRAYEQFGVVIEVDAGEAFYVASAEEICKRTYSVLSFISAKARRHRKKLAAAKPIDEQQRLNVEHHARLALAIEKDTKKHRMNLLLPTTSATEQPKIGPPKPKEA